MSNKTLADYGAILTLRAEDLMPTEEDIAAREGPSCLCAWYESCPICAPGGDTCDHCGNYEPPGGNV